MQCSCQLKFHVRDNKVLTYLLIVESGNQTPRPFDLSQSTRPHSLNIYIFDKLVFVNQVTRNYKLVYSEYLLYTPAETHDLDGFFCPPSSGFPHVFNTVSVVKDVIKPEVSYLVKD